MSNDISKVVVMNGLRLCKEAKCRLCPYGDRNGCMKQLISDAYDLGYELLSIIEKTNKEIDSTKKRGEWLTIFNDSRCSVCGYENNACSVTRVRNNYPFCPNCGADMRGDVNDY